MTLFLISSNFSAYQLVRLFSLYAHLVWFFYQAARRASAHDPGHTIVESGVPVVIDVNPILVCPQH
ncbi:hypothetical protein [Nitrosomonas sp.]|uniref:hypothetical protein n=1 Tax=Nitrosomonas sp. TaxID=42353 RepID=UPI0025DF4061|nr:hypothetical protein [Nitrosomonas sp.]MBY0483684.1 hypothetical protein [Nitrosomonas sp.]